MENVIKKNSELYDELLAVKKSQDETALKLGEDAKALESVGIFQKEEGLRLKTKAQRLKVYEDIETFEKANEARAKELSAESDRITDENTALTEARVKLQKEIADEKLTISSAKEECEALRVSLKKTQEELKEKQAKVDKFLAQVN